MPKIRIVCSDPNATDCSSDEETQSSKRAVYDIELTPKIPTQVENPKKSPYKCVYWRKQKQKWTSEFTDPITHKRYYVGTFETAELAYQAYCAKRRELQEKAEAKKRRKDEAGSLESGDCLSDEKVKRVQPIRNPVRATRLKREKECRKRCSCCGDGDEPKKKPKKTGPVKRTRDRKGIKEKGACEKEKPEFDFSGPISNAMAATIIDENGYLLGEYSKIDDLTILIRG